MTNRKLILILGLLYFFAFIFGFFNVANGNFSQISLLFVPLGIFIWGDSLILGPWMVLVCLWLWIKNRSTLSGLFFSLYGAARSGIEVFYALNAQFSSTTRPWEFYWRDLFIVQSLERTEVFVLWQLVFLCIFIISVFIFIHFLAQYLRDNKYTIHRF